MNHDSVADLIDSSTHSWKPNLVQALYPHPLSIDIIKLPISRIGTAWDKLVWKHSSFRVFQFKKAYKLLLRDEVAGLILGIICGIWYGRFRFP